MKFGVFDHMDDAGVPLGQLYSDRLKLAEAYDRAGIWGYLFLTSGRGLPPAAAAVAGVPLGAMLMALPVPGPGSGALAVAGLMLLGLAAAPVFPLFTLTTGTTRMVSLQVAASAVGGAAVPAGLGLLLGAIGPWLLAPSLLALGVVMGGLYAFIRPG